MVSVRHLGAAAPAAQKASDPIQQLFVDKVRIQIKFERRITFEQHL